MDEGHLLDEVIRPSHKGLYEKRYCRRTYELPTRN